LISAERQLNTLNANTFPIVYAVKHKNFEIRMASRSGGIFTALSDDILSSGGIVYGFIDQFLYGLWSLADCKQCRRILCPPLLCHTV